MEARLVFVRGFTVLAHSFQLVVEFGVGDPTCAVQVPAAPAALVVGIKRRRKNVVLYIAALTRCASHREDTELPCTNPCGVCEVLRTM